MATESGVLTPLRRFFRLLSVDKKDIFYIYVYAVFAGLVNLSLPLGIQAIVNLLFGGQISTAWVILVAAVIVGITFAGVLQIMQLSLVERLQQRIFVRAAYEFAFRIPRVKLEAFRDHYPPELVNRFLDVTSVQKGLSKILMDLSASVLQILFGMVLLSIYHPMFALFCLLLILLVYLIIRVSGPRGVKTSLKESKYKYELVHWLEEVARTVTAFKMAGNTSLPEKKADKITRKYLDARKKHFSVLLFQYSGMVFFKIVIIATLLVFGGLLVVNQEMNIGQFVAAEVIIILIMGSVEKLMVSMETIYDVLTATEKVAAVTDLELERQGETPFRKPEEEQGIAVSLRNVTYFPEGADQAVLDAITLSIESGQHVCIAGENGSGKSSLLRIISGLYTEFSGSLSYNGIPFFNINIPELRAYIGEDLSQEDLFSGSIEENITVGRDDIDSEQVIKACEQTHLMEFIQELPEGFNTQVGTGGRKLPRNIVKKIILARSFAERPRLLIIEDDFLQMKKQDKQDILMKMLDRKKAWTIVMICNDVELLDQFDKIVVMKEGKVLMEGTLEALRKEEWFKDLF